MSRTGINIQTSLLVCFSLSKFSAYRASNFSSLIMGGILSALNSVHAIEHKGRSTIILASCTGLDLAAGTWCCLVMLHLLDISLSFKFWFIHDL